MQGTVQYSNSPCVPRSSLHPLITIIFMISQKSVLCLGEGDKRQQNTSRFVPRTLGFKNFYI